MGNVGVYKHSAPNLGYFEIYLNGYRENWNPEEIWNVIDPKFGACVICGAEIGNKSAPDVEMTFRADLELGEEYQRRFLYLIEWEESKMAKGKFKEWDIWIKDKDGQEILFEVKCDRKARSTGNLAIEFECNNQESGVTSTKADYWIHFVHGEPVYYMIPIDVLKQKIADKKYERIARGGDGFRAKMYLMKMFEFEDYKEFIPTAILNEFRW